MACFMACFGVEVVFGAKVTDLNGRITPYIYIDKNNKKK
jgi:hypothetical protein